MKNIEHYGLNLRAIFATHCHFDHIGAASYLQKHLSKTKTSDQQKVQADAKYSTKIPFYIHKNDKGFVENLQAQVWHVLRVYDT